MTAAMRTVPAVDLKPLTFLHQAWNQATWARLQLELACESGASVFEALGMAELAEKVAAKQYRAALAESALTFTQAA